MTAPLELEIRNVSRRFGGIRAVEECTLDVAAGKITGIVGPNGAGKSTLLKILTGDVMPDGGAVVWNGADITRWSVHKRGAAGIIRTFQLGGEVGRLTVLENLLLGVQNNPGENFIGAIVRRRAWREFERRSIQRGLEILELMGLTAYADRYARDLSGGQKRLLELARALMTDPKILLLDEPMVGVSPVLRDRLIEILLQISANGVACVVVEHSMDVVERLCERVAVMAEGTVIAFGTMSEITADKAVIDAYLN
jgi:ABC-type branched-subunit amino acid transport system ATPase component